MIDLCEKMALSGSEEGEVAVEELQSSARLNKFPNQKRALKHP